MLGGDHCTQSTTGHKVLKHHRPTIQPHENDTILELLCRSVSYLLAPFFLHIVACLTPESHRLLNPIGEHRKSTIVPSKGKRSREKRTIAQAAAEHDVMHILAADVHPPVPAISSALTVGFNSTQRRLETAVRTSVKDRLTADDRLNGSNTELRPSSRVLAAVFVDRSCQHSMLHSHLPLLVAAASASRTPVCFIRLVALPNGAEAKLSGALRIPRVGMIGVEHDAPGAGPLLSFVEEHVPKLDIPWLTNPQNGFLPTEVDAKIPGIAVMQKSNNQQKTSGA